MTYDEILNFNFILSWVHGLRYKQTVKQILNLHDRLGRRIRILEIGCANAKLFQVLNSKCPIDYVGVELSSAFVNEAKEKYGKWANFKIIQGSADDITLFGSAFGQNNSPDVIVCLESFEHMPSLVVKKSLSIIKFLEPKVFISSVPVEVGLSVALKNLASWIFRYHRHKNYTWGETFWASIYRLDKVPVHKCDHKGFDWRWLHSQIKKLYPQVKAKSLPFSFLPKWLANSVFFIAEK